MDIYTKTKLDKITLVQIVRGMFNLHLEGAKSVVSRVNYAYQTCYLDEGFEFIIEALKLLATGDKKVIQEKMNTNKENFNLVIFYALLLYYIK